MAMKGYKRDPETGRFLLKDNAFDWAAKYPEANDWINQPGKANKTAQNHATILRSFVEFTNKTPQELVEMANEYDDKPPYQHIGKSKMKKLIDKLANESLEKGNKHYARSIRFSLKAFFEYHDVVITWKKTERISAKKEKFIKEHIPTKEEIYRMADIAPSLRDKAIILCLFQSGVRINCLLSWTWDMIASMDKEQNELKKFHDYMYPPKNETVDVPIPIMITDKLDSKLRKYQITYYYTYIGGEAADALRAYLDKRLNEGWQPKDNSHLWITHGNWRSGTPLKYISVWKMIKACTKGIGLDPTTVWIHLLRKSFRNVVREIPDVQVGEALMGHTMGIQGSYFDWHSWKDIRELYRKHANFSREGLGFVSGLQKDVEDIKAENIDLQKQLDERIKTNNIREQEFEELKHTLKEHEALLKQLFKKLEKQ